MLNDKKALQKAVDKKPLRHIAEDMGIPYSTLYVAAKRMGVVIPKRTKLTYTEETRKRKSESQKAAYKKKYPNGRFGELHPKWKGGKRLINGYVAIYSPDHPRAGTNKAVFEHILVAEKELGRHLEKDEIVHHINHVKTDNRPDNLEVVKRGEHVKNHFSEPAQLRKRIKYLEKLLKANNIGYN